MKSIIRNSIKFRRILSTPTPLVTSNSLKFRAFSSTSNGNERGVDDFHQFTETTTATTNAASFTDDFAPSSASTVDSVNSNSESLSNVVSSQVAENTAEITDAVAKIGDFTTISGKPYGLFMQGLEHLHVSYGIPYWETIVISALAIRIVLLPLALNSIRTGQRMVKMQPEITALNKRYMDGNNAIPKEKQQEYAKEYGELARLHDVNPARAFILPLFQIPISICAFMGLREMAEYFPDYSSGGTLWFENLAAADPTYTLPVLNSLSFLVIVEMGRFNQVAATTVQQAQQQGMMRNVMRVLGVGMLLVTQSMPAGLLCFWVTSNSWNMLQTAVVSSKMVKDRLK